MFLLSDAEAKEIRGRLPILELRRITLLDSCTSSVSFAVSSLHAVKELASDENWRWPPSHAVAEKAATLATVKMHTRVSVGHSLLDGKTGLWVVVANGVSIIVVKEWERDHSSFGVSALLRTRRRNEKGR